MKAHQVEAEVLEILRDRVTSYGFLSQLYRQEISLPALGHLLDELTREQPAGEVASEGLQFLRQFALAVQRSDLAAVQSELAAEYVSVLLSGDKKGVSPFESVYTSAERLLMQEARDQVLAAYRAEGLAKIAEFREPEDHIAIELEFMAHLCQQTIEMLEKGNVAGGLASLDHQKTFLEQHLLVWVPEFCQNLFRVSRSDFFRGLARLTQEHLDQERETIAEIVGVLEEAPCPAGCQEG